MRDPAPKAAPSNPRLPGRSFVLRFISGKYKGGEFPVVPDKEILVGRSSELDMVLVEDMVSRKHARIAMQGDQIWVEDLDSTNGTFVNGEKIKRSRLKEGDRVLIGTSILRLIAGDATRPVPEAKKDLQNISEARRASQQRTMTGSIGEVPLPDLLQLFSTSKKSGVLVVRDGASVGRIHLNKGNISHAAIDHLEDISPVKSLYRMLTWPEGQFDLEPAPERPVPKDINMSAQELLMEGMRQLDEMNLIRKELPAAGAHLAIAAPLNTPLRDLTPEELDVLQLAHNMGSLEALLNASPVSDLDVCQIVLKLVKASYLRVE